MELYFGNGILVAKEENIYLELAKEDISISEVLNRLKEAIEQYKSGKETERLIPHPYTITQWIREYRNHLLAESDWTQLPDAPLKEEERQAWKDYRQALRDLPQTWGLSPVGTMPETSKVSIDLSVVNTKEDISKLPFPEKPK